MSSNSEERYVSQDEVDRMVEELQDAWERTMAPMRMTGIRSSQVTALVRLLMEKGVLE